MRLVPVYLGLALLTTLVDHCCDTLQLPPSPAAMALPKNGGTADSGTGRDHLDLSNLAN